MNRAAVSIPSNIAEGSGRETNKDFIRFLDIALGSTFELETQMIIADNISMVQNYQTESIFEYLIEIQKMITGLKKVITEINSNFFLLFTKF